MKPDKILVQSLVDHPSLFLQFGRVTRKWRKAKLL